MSKPICTISIPHQHPLTWEHCRSLQDDLDKTRPDYHWFPLLDSTIDRIEFKVFYEKDFTEIQYEELKAFIEEKIKVH
jgi:hypothetical protein